MKKITNIIVALLALLSFVGCGEKGVELSPTHKLLLGSWHMVEWAGSAAEAEAAQIAESVSVKNGKLICFNDLLEDAKKNDASAFVNKEQQNLEQNKARFTTSMNNQNGNNNGNLTKKDIMAIKDPVERQQKIAENMSLFQK